jgi:hypothetical protein
MRKTFLVILAGLLSAVCAQAATVYTKVSGKPVNDWPGTYIIVYEKSDAKALVWDGEDNSAFRRTFNVMVSNATALPSNKEESPKARKIIRNGQILILRGDKTYTITGQVMSK